jgi:uncharacterized protein (DUF433 family)
MQLEDYFDFLAPDDIRVKGTRVGIETILSDYLEMGLFPEDIALRYPTLSLEAVYATITYYWHNREQVDAYLRAWREYGERMRQEQERNPSPAVRRLREMIQQRQSESQVQAALSVCPATCADTWRRAGTFLGFWSFRFRWALVH